MGSRDLRLDLCTYHRYTATPSLLPKPYNAPLGECSVGGELVVVVHAAVAPLSSRGFELYGQHAGVIPAASLAYASGVGY